MTADPTLAAILANILDHPGEDLPRLAYADRLDDLGLHARADVIRVGVEVARLGLPDGPCPPGCPCGGAGNRAAELVATHGDEPGWAPPLPGERPGQLAFLWRRGFPDEVRCSAATWLEIADATLQAHPVQRVTLTTWPEGTAMRANRLRKWKQPSRLGGHVLDSWRAEWPGVAFTLPDLPGHMPGVGERVAAQVAAQFAREDFGDAPPPRPAFGTATAAEVADALEYAREQDRLDAERP
jgi:uncharacterized protein (TIGR02996 family)